MSAHPELRALDGVAADDVAARIRSPRLVLLERCASTLDVAHSLAGDGAPSGTIVVADEQTAGRGRHGRVWASAPGAGLWLTLIERHIGISALDVLSLRCGLHAAEALDALAGVQVGLKWPNDLYVGGRKLAGILIETRWRGPAPEWVAIGMGINVRAPDLETAAGLRAGVTRLETLAVVAPALRAAAALAGPLSPAELARWRARDVAAGRTVTAPSPGVAEGITAGGELVVRRDGALVHHRAGSLILSQPIACS